MVGSRVLVSSNTERKDMTQKLCDAWDYGLNKCKPTDLDPKRGCIRDHAAESCFILPNIEDM